MDRSYEFLLNKYKTKQPGEQWTNKHEVKYIREYRNKQKLFQLEGLLNREFRVQPNQKKRMQYLTKTLDFSKMGTWNNEQIILMIIIYTKLEANPKNRIIHYKHILNRYELTTDSFIGFLVNLNKHHIQKIPC